MATTKITSNVLAPSAAQTNINNDGSFTLSVPTQINNTLSLSGNLTVDTNTLFVDSTNNSVGIGTTTPTAGYALDVVGAAKIGGNILCGGSILYLNSQQSLTQGTNSLTLGAATYFTTINYGNASTTIHNFAAGKVGIGTATPSAKLDVRSTETGVSYFNSSAASTRLLIDNAANTGFGLQIAGATKFSNAVYQSGTGNFDFTIYNDQLSQPSLFVDGSTNNVGIGTTTPNEKLHIYDSVDAHLKIAGADTAGSIRKLSLERSTGGAEIHFNEDTRTTQGLTLNTTNAAYPMSFQINGDTKMFVSTAGSVGIGTTTPTEKLTVAGNISVTGNINATGNLTVDTNTLFVDSVNNRVGIGTATPGGAKLVIKNDNDSSTWLLQTQNDNGNTNSLFTQNPAGDFVWNGYRNGTTIGSPELSLHTNGDSFFNGGNVGIGTATPNEKLTVAGNISVTGNISATGHFSAATKSFKIPHQSKGGHLQYGVVESDCHSVLVRGKISSDTITLPEHWSWLVDADSVTVQLTPVGCYQQLYIVSSDNQTVKVGGVTGEYCYVVYGTRKDVAPLEVEIE